MVVGSNKCLIDRFDNYMAAVSYVYIHCWIDKPIERLSEEFYKEEERILTLLLYHLDL